MAFVAGGSGMANVEVYSPSGGCSYQLGYVPYAQYAPILGMINRKITYCSWYNDKRCSQYNPTTGNWTDYTTMNYYHYGAAGNIQNLI